MNSILIFLVQSALTLVILVLIMRYLRPFLSRVLLDLCGTEERAQFWTAFSNLLLIGLPMIIALGFRPTPGDSEAVFFEVAAKISGNLGGFLLALVGVGLIVTFFALVAARQPGAEAK